MTEWQKIRLGDHMKVKHGFAFDGKHITDSQTKNILVTPGNFLIGGGFKDKKYKYFSGDFPSEYLLRSGDLVITMTDLSKEGDTLGYPAFIPTNNDARFLHNQRIGKVVFEDKRIDKKFLYYRLCASDYRHEILSSATGTSIKHTSPKRIESFQVLVPQIGEQLSIASVLGSLDDKIELNRRMNETLEAIAQAIFKDWFVDFGPVRRKAAGIEDPVAILGGMIGDPARASAIAALFPDRIGENGLPEGWVEEPLKDQADWINGAAYKKIHFVPPNEGLPVVKIGELKSGISASTGFTNSDLGSRYKINNGELLFSWSGNPDTSIDTFIWSGGPAWLNQHIFAVRPNGKKELGFLFSMLKFLNPTFAEIARDKQTTGLGHVTKEDLKRLQIVISIKDIEVEFDRFASSIFELILNNLLEIGTLSETRDYLLPKLMSGEIRVSDAEALMKEAAE